MKTLIIICMFLAGCSPVLRIGAGFTYAEKIPTTHLTGHEQFHLSIELEQRMTEHWSVVGGYNHISNGADLGIGRHPNRGLDFYGARLEYRINLYTR